MLRLLHFNQDNTCLAVASETAFAIYNCDPFDSCYVSSPQHSVSIAEMLFSTSLVAIVDPHLGTSCLRIINTKKNSTICELAFPVPILNVKMNRKRIIVVLTNQLLIYDVSCMKLLKNIDFSFSIDPPSIDSIACALSSSDYSILAFQQFDPPSNSDAPSNTTETNTHQEENEISSLGSQSGNVVIFDALKLSPISIINCHKSGVQKLTLSENGILLATASTKGTIIRIFNTQTGSKMYEFRRGSLPATICSLTFNSDNSILACSSDTGTVHFFSVPDHISELGISKELMSSSSSSSSPATISNSSTVMNKISQTGLPRSSELTPEETEEVQKLMDSTILSKKKPSTATQSTLQKTKKLTNYLWSRSKQYLPQQINAILEPKRDFAFIRLPTIGTSVIGLVENTCYIATTDGLFLQYVVPPVPTQPSALRQRDSEPESGSVPASPLECRLVKHHQIPL